MAIKIEFPAGDTLAAWLFGNALINYSEQHDGALPELDYVKAPEPSKPVAQPQPDEDDTPDDLAQFIAGGPVPEPAPAGVDHNGVVKNPDYCGDSAEPFYASGKMAGQWKKKRGVDQDDYDAWYASELAAKTGDSEPDDAAPADTSAAFAAPAPAPVEADEVPSNCGEFMTWISEHQVAERLTAEDISAAYAEHGIGVTDLFPPNDDETIGARIRALFGTLSAKVSG